MKKKFKVKKANKHDKAFTGALRSSDADKPRLELISPFFEERLGMHLNRGITQGGYPERNWEQGVPFCRCVGSMKRHLNDFLKGKDVEDNLAAVAFGAMALIHFEEMIKLGVLPKELDDRPDYHGKGKK